MTQMVKRSFLTAEMGLRLRQLRQEDGLTQEDVAERMGLKGLGRWMTASKLKKGRSCA
jgi:transcriptional regulator with XRE-family HTH domain